ncbi:MAG TPA: aspartate-semialdehyde dehydrogenase [Bacillota bacterium]|nr:aspartate-semialdehyde dehydrogenase [Bacillota bacterium]
MSKVCIVGATGAVGREFIAGLKELGFPVTSLKLLATERSAGKTIETPYGDLLVEVAKPSSFDGMDFAFFSAGAAASKELAPEAARRGCVAVDNSSAWRMDPGVPLVVPEVNMEAARSHKGIIANPNCSTIIMCVALEPIYRKYGITRVVASTYQAVSGAGWAAMEALRKESEDFLAGRPVKPEALPIKSGAVHHQIAFNLIPHIDVFYEDGFTKEEHKMVDETRKIFADPRIRVCATTVRVPVFRSHSESLNIETEKDFEIEDVKDAIATGKGLVLEDDPARFVYPMPAKVAGSTLVHVGRVRLDGSAPRSLAMWVVGDQLKKGAATNAIQIALGLLA